MQQQFQNEEEKNELNHVIFAHIFVLIDSRDFAASFHIANELQQDFLSF